MKNLKYKCIRGWKCEECIWLWPQIKNCSYDGCQLGYRLQNIVYVERKDMEFKDAIESLNLKFTSGNKIPVERTTIVNEEWQVIKKELKRLQEIEFIYEELKK